MKLSVTTVAGSRRSEITDVEVLNIQQFLSVCRDAALAAGFRVEEVGATNSFGDTFWTDDPADWECE